MDSLPKSSDENKKQWEEEKDEEILTRAHNIFFSSPEESDGESNSQRRQQISEESGSKEIKLPSYSTPLSLPLHNEQSEIRFDLSPIEPDINSTYHRKSKRLRLTQETNLHFENSFLTPSRHQNKKNFNKMQDPEQVSDCEKVGSRKRRRCKVQCVVVSPATQNCTPSASGINLNKIRSLKTNINTVDTTFASGRNDQFGCSTAKTMLSVRPLLSSTPNSKGNVCKKKAVNNLNHDISLVKELENEIEDVHSLRQSHDHETIGSFETEAPIWIEPEVIADLLREDDSIYDQLSDTEDKIIDEEMQMKNVPNFQEEITKENSIDELLNVENLTSSQKVNSQENIIDESLNVTRGQEEKESVESDKIRSVEDSLPLEHSTDPASNGNSVDSSNDLFVPETNEDVPTNVVESNDLTKLSDLSSQETSEHYEFRLSESDESDKSWGSDELFL